MNRVLGFLYGLAVWLLGWMSLFLSLSFGDRLPRRRLVNWWGFLADERGAVTVTFQYPVTGVVAPTAAQIALLSAVVANVIATADADTTAVITHNMGLTAAQLAAGFPFVILQMLIAYTAATVPGWAVTASATNAITCTKNATVGTGNAGAQLQVTILRPNTLIQ